MLFCVCVHSYKFFFSGAVIIKIVNILVTGLLLLYIATPHNSEYLRIANNQAQLETIQISEVLLYCNGKVNQESC